MPEYDIECESSTVISTNSLLVYENKYYLQVYLDDWACKIATKQVKVYLNEIFFKD